MSQRHGLIGLAVAAVENAGIEAVIGHQAARGA
jgi:hypothetical protein